MRQQQDNGPSDLQASFGWTLGLLDCMALPMNVILHHRMGSRYIDWRGLISIILILFFTAAFPASDGRPMVAFLLVFLGMCLLSRITSSLRASRGDEGHSRYDGFPWICHAVPLDELTIKRWVEPLGTLLLGMVVRSVSLPLGTFLAWAGAATFFTGKLADLRDRTRCQDLHDAMIEQQWLMHQYHNRNQGL